MSAFLNITNIFNGDPARTYPGPDGSPFYSLLGEWGNGSPRPRFPYGAAFRNVRDA
ncbi:MAG: hypothetical protein AB7I36_07505 [Rhodospirillaceae bacterium]